MLFDKYLDFIDMYAEITEEEKESVYQDLKEHKETAMLAQYIKNKGFEEGMQQGKYGLLERILIGRFGPLPEWAMQRLGAASPEQLDRWAERVLEAESIQGVLSD
jgi:hypothetical protein